CALGRAVEHDGAGAGALVEADAVQRRRHDAVLEGDGEVRLAEPEGADGQLLDRQLGVGVERAERREIEGILVPAVALRIAFDTRARRRGVLEEVLDGARFAAASLSRGWSRATVLAARRISVEVQLGELEVGVDE